MPSSGSQTADILSCSYKQSCVIYIAGVRWLLIGTGRAHGILNTYKYDISTY